MTKLLSQDEIDALLTNSEFEAPEVASSSGQKLISVYNFRHPDRVSKDQMRALRTIHERFGRGLATYLSSTIRLMVDMKIDSIDQVTYSEYAMSLSSPSCIYVVNFNALNGSGLIEVSPDLFFYLIDRLLGGTGKQTIDPREVTIIEQKVMEKILVNALTFLDEAWASITSLDSHLESFETNAQFVQIAPPSETVVIVIFDVLIREQTFQMNLAIPYYVLEPAMPKLSAQSWISLTQLKGSHADTKTVQENLIRTEVGFKAALGTADISIRDFVNLQKGDLIRLNERVTDPLKLKVNEKLKFIGRPGTLGMHKAVQIEEIVDAEKEGYYVRGGNGN